MSAFLNQQLTNAGWDALSVALGGGRLTFFKMQAGSGTIANDAAILGMTQLVQPVCDIGITKYSIEGDGQITLFGNITSAQIDVGFTFRELGVFCTIEQPVAGLGGVPSGPNIQVVSPPVAGVMTNPVVPPPSTGTPLMYSYCNSYANSDYIPGKTETTDVVNTIQVTIKIDQAQNVIINITAGQQLSVANIGPPTVGAGPWSFTQSNVAWLKRLVPGPATVISEDANTITIGQKQLTVDLDLYVANGNPDISPNFSSIQKALNYLGQFIIPTTIRARINVSAGTYVWNQATVCDHPNAQSITIQGPQNNRVTGTSGSLTGSANNWSLLIGGIANTSQFKVNDYAIIDYAGVTGDNHGMFCGFFKVTAVTASSVTVLIPNPKSSFSITGVTTISITPISVMLTNSVVNGTVMVIGSYGIGVLQCIGIKPTVAPTLTGYGIVINGPSKLWFFGATGFQLAMNSAQDNYIAAIQFSESGWLGFCAATNNQSGIVVSGNGSVNMQACAISYNSFRGLWIEHASVGICFEPTFVAANNQGVVVANNGMLGIVATIPPGYLLVQRNDNWGMWCYAGGGCSFTSTVCTLYMSNNTQLSSPHFDIVVQNYGIVNASVCVTGTRIFNSPVGTINSSGGLIN